MSSKVDLQRSKDGSNCMHFKIIYLLESGLVDHYLKMYTFIIIVIPKKPSEVTVEMFKKQK